MADTIETLRQEIDALKQAVKVPPGTLFAFAGDQAPSGFLMADGKTVDPNRPEFAALCAIIGDRFNLPSDPVGTYRLPDLRGRFLLGAGQGNGLTGRRVGQTMGAETHTLSVPELPAHNHPLNEPLWAFSGDAMPLLGGTNNGMVAGYPYHPPGTRFDIGNTGGGQPFSIMPPTVVVTFIIKY